MRSRCLSISILAVLGLFALAGVATGQPAWVWRQRTPAASPSARIHHAMAFDSARGRVVLFGGLGQATVLADTWEWDGSTWVQRMPAAGPVGRLRTAMAFDRARGRTVLFGGKGVAGLLADTWEWDGNDWVELRPATSPPAREGHMLVYHEGQRRTLLFGGQGPGALQDTWEWTGANWVAAAPLFSPPARHSSAGAYDPYRDRVDLFGGKDARDQLLDDTWEWDRVYWNWLLPAASPAARADHGLAFDRLRGRGVLFGGTGASGPLADTWEWDGDGWSPVQGAAGPQARAAHALAYDSLRGQTVLFGGLGLAPLGDTWEYGSILEGSFRSTGPGCRSSQGKIPLLSAAGLPELGGRISFALGDAPFGMASVLCLDALNPRLDLGPYGAPGCTAFVRPGFLVAWYAQVLFSGGWSPSPEFRLPLESALVGAGLQAQAFIRDPAANALGWITSGGIQATIGYGGIGPIELNERFLDGTMLDPDGSGARWGGGRLVPGLLGGSGLLGSFHPDMFVGLAPIGGTLNLSTDSVRVKAEHALTGQEVVVGGGLFAFDEFHVPQGLTVNFLGSNPVRILVRGAARIEGKIQVNGFDAPVHEGNSTMRGAGGRSNCGGGAGGQGGLRGGNGEDGSPLAFPAGSVRFRSPAAIGAAGKGSPVFPASLAAITYHGYDGWVCAQLAAGGSGGGNATVGTKGWGTLTGQYNPIWVATDVPADNNPGVPFVYLPKLASEPSTLQFLAGGSGGGGGGSHPFHSMKSYTVEWHTGQGGGGGGGALLLRAGGDVAIAATGILEAAGGNSPHPRINRRATPGGGGSGGDILVQSGGRFRCQGKVWAPGGLGGVYQELASYNWGVRAEGGAGGFGYLRVEAPVPPTPAELAGFDPPGTADNAGPLEERDALTGARSRFYRTLLHRPGFDHFRVEALENGRPVVYSDDPLRGRMPLFDPGRGTAVALFLQGARLDALGQPVPGSLTRWVKNCAALNDPANWGGSPPTAVRFALLLDTAVLSAPGSLEVQRVTIASK